MKRVTVPVQLDANHVSEGFAHRNKDDSVGIDTPEVLDGKACVYITAASSCGSHPYGVRLQAMPACNDGLPGVCG
jgi:hypothetical protein